MNAAPGSAARTLGCTSAQAFREVTLPDDQFAEAAADVLLAFMDGRDVPRFVDQP